MPVTEFRRMESITPSGEQAAVKFEQAINDAIAQAEDDGLCYGMIIAALTTAQWWMCQRAHEED